MPAAAPVPGGGAVGFHRSFAWEPGRGCTEGSSPLLTRYLVMWPPAVRLSPTSRQKALEVEYRPSANGFVRHKLVGSRG